MVRRNPLDLPPEVARAFLKDMRACFAEREAIKRDAIAARQLNVLKEYQGPEEMKLRLSDVKEILLQLRDDLG